MPQNLQAERARYERAAGAVESSQDLTVRNLCVLFLRHAETYYKRRPGTSSELKNFRWAFKSLKFYLDSPASEFGPMKLRAVREFCIEQGYARVTVNQIARRVVTLFGFATERELVDPKVWHGMKSVQAIRKGRSAAPETPPIRAVSESAFTAAISFMAPQVRAMCELQWWTGMRPGEVVGMVGERVNLCNSVAHGARTTHRTCAAGANGATIAASAVATYSPEHHKTEHHGKARTIFLGPEAQRVIHRWLRPGFLFLTEKRDEPYTVGGYRQAIHRGCDSAQVDRWSPNQLRHSAATRIRKEAGLDAARVLLGHSDATTTEIYAERDADQAIQAALKYG